MTKRKKDSARMSSECVAVVKLDGKDVTVRGRYHVDGGMVHVDSGHGTKAAVVYNSSSVDVLARLLLGELARSEHDERKRRASAAV